MEGARYNVETLPRRAVKTYKRSGGGTTIESWLQPVVGSSVVLYGALMYAILLLLRFFTSEHKSVKKHARKRRLLDRRAVQRIVPPEALAVGQ